MKGPRVLQQTDRYQNSRRTQETLGDLMQRKVELIAVCKRCKHRRLLLVPNLAERLGEGYRVLSVRHVLRCQQCRALGAVNLHETAR